MCCTVLCCAVLVCAAARCVLQLMQQSVALEAQLKREVDIRNDMLRVMPLSADNPITSFPNHKALAQLHSSFANNGLETMREVVQSLADAGPYSAYCTVNEQLFRVISPAYSAQVQAVSQRGSGSMFGLFSSSASSLQTVRSSPDAVAAALVLSTWQYTEQLFHQLTSAAQQLSSASFLRLQHAGGGAGGRGGAQASAGSAADDELHYEALGVQPTEVTYREARAFQDDLSQRLIVHLQKGHRWVSRLLCSDEAVVGCIDQVKCQLTLQADERLVDGVREMLVLFWQLQLSRPQLRLHWENPYHPQVWRLDERQPARYPDVQTVLWPVLTEGPRVQSMGLAQSARATWS